jgi:hypothetical protein
VIVFEEGGPMQKARVTPVLLAAVLIATAFAGLQAQAPPTTAAHPAAAAHRQFVRAVVDGELPEAKTLMSRALIAALPQLGGLSKACADRVGPGTIRGVQTLATEVKDKKAVVSYRLHMTDGTTRPGKDTMVFEDGAWKLDVKGAR